MYCSWLRWSLCLQQFKSRWNCLKHFSNCILFISKQRLLIEIYNASDMHRKQKRTKILFIIFRGSLQLKFATAELDCILKPFLFCFLIKKFDYSWYILLICSLNSWKQNTILNFILLKTTLTKKWEEEVK